MNRKRHAARPVALMAALAAAYSLAPSISTAAEEAPPAVASQLEQGEAAYTAQCASCHAPNMRGGANEFAAPALTGPFFFSKWEGRSWGAFLEYAQQTMPPGMGGSLSSEDYLAIVALVISRAGHELDEPLSADSPRLGETVSRAAR